MPLEIITLGEIDRAEFQPVREVLAVHCPNARRQEFSGGDLAQSGIAADLWIICQSWPDEFSTSSVRQIVDLSATSRLICVYGAWCASDGRTRSAWPQAVRVPVDEFDWRLRFELDVIAGGIAPLPLTAARDEQFAVRASYAAEQRAFR